MFHNTYIKVAVALAASTSTANIGVESIADGMGDIPRPLQSCSGSCPALKVYCICSTYACMYM